MFDQWLSGIVNHDQTFPGSRGSFPGVCRQKKRDLCHGSKMAILTMLRGLATGPLRNARLAYGWSAGNLNRPIRIQQAGKILECKVLMSQMSQ